MKEATGELNLTVVTVIAIAAVVGIVAAFILPAVQNNIQLQTACNAAGGTAYNDAENNIACAVNSGVVTCTLTTASNQTVTKTCN